MKHLLYFSLAGMICITCHSQQPTNDRGEFATNPNGLMYSDADMKHLRFIVDSLNLKYKTCDLNSNYYSLPQTKVWYASFKSTNSDLLNIIEDIKNKVSYPVLIEKYKSLISTVDTSQIIIRRNNTNDENDFLEGKPKDGYDNISLKGPVAKKKNLAGEWHYDYSAKDKKEKDGYYYLSCRYFPGNFEQIKIPEPYGKLIQYVDCMIDTSSFIYLTEKYEGGWYREDDKKGYKNLKELNEYINQKMSPNLVTKSSDNISQEQFTFASENLSSDPVFRELVGKTVDKYVEKKNFDYRLEKLSEICGLFDKALLMKRSYRVMGSCSQDESPRLHARDIAILAGKSHSWDIFLRAHLDIMNDRFERASDGSYAWGERKTYLKELEELNLNIVDLMLGLTLRATNVAPNHYYGTVWRLGWALTESKERSLFESKAISIMKDTKLDEFNRGLVFLLYRSYIDHLDEKESNEKITTLKKDKDNFPSIIKNSIEEIQSPKQRKRGR